MSTQAALWFIKRTLKNKFPINAARLLIDRYIAWNHYHTFHSKKNRMCPKGICNLGIEKYLSKRCSVLNFQPLWRRGIESDSFRKRIN